MDGRTVGLTLAIASALAFVRLDAQTNRPTVQPSTVDTIIVENRNIFDSSDPTPGWVANLANGLHVRTRHWVIRRRLLLNPGDAFDPARLEALRTAARAGGRPESARRIAASLVDLLPPPAGAHA